MSASRREKQKKETFDEIIRVARGQIASQGAANLSLRAIAREMEMSTPALYRYFDNRDALVTTLIQIAYQSLTDALVTARQSNQADSSATQLYAAGMAYREWGVQNPEMYALIFGTPIPGYNAPPENTLPLARSALGVLIDILVAGAAAGEFVLPKNSPDLNDGLIAQQPEAIENKDAICFALQLWSLTHGLTSLELFNHFTILLNDPAENYQLAIQQTLEKLIAS